MIQKKIKDLKMYDFILPARPQKNGLILPPKIVTKIIKSKLETGLVEIHWNYAWNSFGNDAIEIRNANDMVAIYGNYKEDFK